MLRAGCAVPRTKPPPANPAPRLSINKLCRTVGKHTTDGLKNISFRCRVQALGRAGGSQRVLRVARPQRLPGRLAQGICLCHQKHQRSKISTAARTFRSTAKTGLADGTAESRSEEHTSELQSLR